MSEGNPGALAFIAELMAKEKEVDPDNGIAGIAGLLNADRIGIYGTDLYILHNDLCDRDIVLSVAMLRATQLGLLQDSTLKEACHRQDRTGKQLVNVEEVYESVCKELPNFKKR